MSSAVREDAPPAARAFQRRMRNVASEPKGQTASTMEGSGGVFSRFFRLIPVTGYALSFFVRRTPDPEGGNEAVRI